MCQERAFKWHPNGIIFVVNFDGESNLRLSASPDPTEVTRTTLIRSNGI